MKRNLLRLLVAALCVLALYYLVITLARSTEGEVGWERPPDAGRLASVWVGPAGHDPRPA
jgi:hypothetical protein